ncbi:polysaccharide deacetylase family protein [Streptomyces sp. KLOTTS4A1]|uniref:polysaccharide deacetylase family protein n=1 Tax=Streptomyces sp. KLOTTS4A1 TaxID=3390996 RepID=UPI0039F4E826
MRAEKTTPQASAGRAEVLAGKREPWIWMYHSVADASWDPYGITVEPRRLAVQLGWLRRRGLKGVSIRELLAAQRAGQGGRLIGLSFDDGYADFAEHALPVLREFGFSATVFVLAGHFDGVNAWDPLGPRKRLLGPPDIRTIAAAGIEIGSHGLEHRDLTDLSPGELRREVAESRTLLESVTGQAVAGFCYPYGYMNAGTLRAVSAAGYRYACAITPGPLAGAMALPRVHISQADRPWRLQVKRFLHRVPLRLGPARTPSPSCEGQAGR